MTGIEQRIRESLERSVQQAPTVGDVHRRLSAGVKSEVPRNRRRWRGTATAAVAAAAVVSTILVVAGRTADPAPSPAPGSVGNVTRNPSARPDLALCRSLLDQAGNPAAALVRGVTVPTDEYTAWLDSRGQSTTPLAGSGSSEEARATTICVYSSSPIALDSSVKDLSQATGMMIAARSAEHYVIAGSGNLQALVEALNPLQKTILDEIASQPRPGPNPRRWGTPCSDNRATTLGELPGSSPVKIRVPNTVLANLDNLDSVWMCGDTPQLIFATVEIFFESGWDRDDYPTLWQGLLKDHPGWATTVFGNPALVLHPVDGSYGEVLYVEDGTLMRVLGDGSIPAEQLLDVVRSSLELAQALS